MPSWSRLDLGVGLIATGGVDLIWDDIADLVGLVEVEPQTLWDHTAGDGQSLGAAALTWLLSRDRPLLSHGVGFPVGGTVSPDPRGIAASARSARQLGARHWSEDLSFNRAGPDGRHAGYLLPPIPHPQTVAAAVSHISHYQDELELPFLIETPANYLRPVADDLSDGEFVAQIAEQADCGILLDLHNIWANEHNGRQPVADFLAELPLDRVWELHLAGGYCHDGYYLDAHVGAVAEPLLELAAAVVPRLPNLRAIVFEAVPESIATLGSTGLRAVLHRLHDLAALPVDPRPAAALPHRSGSALAPGRRACQPAAPTDRRVRPQPDRRAVAPVPGQQPRQRVAGRTGRGLRRMVAAQLSPETAGDDLTDRRSADGSMSSGRLPRLTGLVTSRCAVCTL